MTESVRITMDDAKLLLVQAFTANGVRAETAGSVAAALVDAQAEGQAGHGFSRLADYIAQVRSGKIDGQALPETRQLSPAALFTDAKCGFAYPALDQAIAQGTALAQETGTVSMSVSNSHHCGALSVQVDRIARQGLVALMFANTPAAIAPWGAGKPVFGTNPIAFAAPRDDADPLVIDLSLSRVARGKVMHASKTGQAIPTDWALDRDGNPTTDPNAALEGSMMPIGGAKGTALALMVEVLAAAMTGANFSADASSFFKADGPAPRVGQFLIAFCPGDPSGFAGRLEDLLALIVEQEGTRLPGTRRLAALRVARDSGLEVPAQYIDTARALAGLDRLPSS